MSIFKCVFALLVLSTTALSPSRLSCYKSATSGLSFSSLFALCRDPRACESAASDLRTALLSCQLPLASTSVLSSIESMLYGVFVGFQANPTSPSACATSFSSGQLYWDQVVQAVGRMLSGDGALTEVFNVLTFFDQFLTQTISSVERCNLETLRKHVADLGTVEGVFKLMYVVGLNIDSLATYFWNFLSDFFLGNFESAGISLGQIFSVALNYQI